MNRIIIPKSLGRYLCLRIIARIAVCVALWGVAGLVLVFGKEIYAELTGTNLTLFYLVLALAPIALSGVWQVLRYPAWQGEVTDIKEEKVWENKKSMREFTLTLRGENGKDFARKYRLPSGYFDGPELYEVGDYLYRIGGTRYICCLPTRVNDPLRCVACGQYYAPDMRRCKKCGRELILPSVEPTGPARVRHGEKK